MIRIYREGAKTALGPEVARWEGIFREIVADPIGTREMTDAEKRVSLLCCPPSMLQTLQLTAVLSSATLREILVVLRVT